MVAPFIAAETIAREWRSAQEDLCGFRYGCIHVAAILGCSKEYVASIVLRLGLPSSGP